MAVTVSPPVHVDTDELYAASYPLMHRIASRLMSREREGDLLQTTALVHEACIKILGRSKRIYERSDLLRATARAMRQVLVDHARRRLACKRIAGSANGNALPPSTYMVENPEELVALDDALDVLEQRCSRQRQIVELRFFAGLEVREIAEVLGISQRAVRKHWAFTRAWLHREMSRDTSP